MTPERFAQLSSVLDRRQPDLTVLMDDVHKSHNLSAVLRTCDAVGVLEAHAVNTTGEVARHQHRAGGSAKWVEVAIHTSVDAACDALEAQGFQLLAAHLGPGAIDFRLVDYTRPTALVLGSEKRGVGTRAATRAHQHVSIPMHGQVASLNVSVAAAVVLFEAERQRAAAGLYDRPRLDPALRARLLFEWAYPRLAAWCRQHGKRYPELDAQGFLVGDPRL
jgi:tRNA (guanosine-2'-O-)-methyltransferase